MALPPEAIEDVLPAAAIVVDAEVVLVRDLGAWPPGDKGAPLDGAPPRPAQEVTLQVTRVLHGKAGAQLVATKPPANYALRRGVSGPFLVDQEARILGRYGPDTWGVDEVEAALRALARPQR